MVSQQGTHNGPTHTDWFPCKDGPWYPNLPHGGFTAYRIWHEFDGRNNWQRHEWRHADGTTEVEKWIRRN